MGPRERIGDYTIFGELGRGGMGTVKLALRDGFDRLGVLKEVVVQDPALRALLKNEALLMTQLVHPNLARLRDAKFDGAGYLVTEYVAGADLHRVDGQARQKEPLTLEEIVFVLAEVAGAMHFAHEVPLAEGRQGVIHRDLKPSNVMVGFEGRVKVIDFGLAVGRAPDGSVDTSVVQATDEYAAPEVLYGSPPNVRQDVFALGLIAFDLVTGGRPEPPATDSRVERLIALTDRSRWPALPNLPPPLRLLIERAIEPNVDRRLSSMAEFERGLRALLEGRPTDKIKERLGEKVRRLFPEGWKFYGDIYHEVEREVRDQRRALLRQTQARAAFSPGRPGAAASVEQARAQLESGPGSILDRKVGSEGTQVVRQRKVREADEPPAEWVGEYLCLKKVAEGGHGQVFLAVRKHSSEPVVLKTLRHEAMGHSTAGIRFEREGKISAQLPPHPNLVRLVDTKRIDERWVLAFRFIPSIEVEQAHFRMLAKGQLLPLEMTLAVAVDALAGLSAAHEAKDARGRPLDLVHRDLSPRNILLGLDGHSQVIDFGVARAHVDDFATAPGMVLGTLRYSSPEVLWGRPTDARGDVYAIGVILYELLSGCDLVPRVARDSEGVVRDLRPAEVATLGRAANPRGIETPPSVPQSLWNVVLKALEKDPDERYPTAAAMRQALVEAMPTSMALIEDRRLVREAIQRLFPDDVAKTQAFLDRVPRRLAAEQEPVFEETRAAALSSLEVREAASEDVSVPTRTSFRPRASRAAEPAVLLRYEPSLPPPAPSSRAPWAWVAGGVLVLALGGLVGSWGLGLREERVVLVEGPPQPSPPPVATPEPIATIAAVPASPEPPPVVTKVLRRPAATPTPSRSPKPEQPEPLRSPPRLDPLDEQVAACEASNAKALAASVRALIETLSEDDRPEADALLTQADIYRDCNRIRRVLAFVKKGGR